MMADYYGYRLKFYCTSSGLRAIFQGATDRTGATWEDVSDEYAPDTTADPESIGATVSASGIALPSGTAIASTPSQCQYWLWSLENDGNIPIQIPKTGRGAYFVQSEFTFSGADDSMVAFFLGDTTPAGDGFSTQITRSAAGTKTAKHSYDDNTWSGTFTADYKYADFTLSYNQDTGSPELSRVDAQYYNTSALQEATYDIDLSGTMTKMVFGILVGRLLSATVSVTINPIGYLYWPGLGPEIAEPTPGPANQIIENYYNALLIQDERIVTSTINEIDSSYTASDRVVGTPTSVSDTNIIPIASGEQSATNYDIFLAKGGFPDEAGFLWRVQNEQVYGYLGQENITVSQRLAIVDFYKEPYYPCTITTNTGRVVIAYGSTADGGFSETLIKWGYYDGGAGFDYKQTLVTDGEDFYLEKTDTNAGTTYAGCCMLYDEINDEILIFVRAIFETSASTKFIQIWTYSSLDNGVTFNIKSKNAIKAHDGIVGLIFDDHAFERMGVIWVGRAIMLFIAAYTNDGVDEGGKIITLSSYDFGNSFVFLEEDVTEAATDISCAGNTVIYRRRFVVEQFRYKQFYSIQSWSAVDYQTVSTISTTYTKCTDFGLLYTKNKEYVLVAGISGDASDWEDASDKWGQDIRIFKNVFNENITYSIGSIFSSGDPTTAFKQLCLAEYQGGLLMFYKQTGGALYSQLLGVFLGGYTNLSLPSYYDDITITFPSTTAAISVPIAFGDNLTLNYESFGTYPIDFPPSSIWTSSGSDTIVLYQSGYQPYYWISASGSSPGKYYTHAISGGGQEIIVEFEVRRNQNSLKSAGTKGSGVEIVYDDGLLKNINIFLEIYKSGSDYTYALKNINSATVLYTGDFGSSGSLKFRIAYALRKIRLFVSNNSEEDYNSIYAFKLVYSSDSLTTVASSGAKFDLSWGIYSASAGENFYLYYINFIATTGDDWDLSTVDTIDADTTDYRYPVTTSSKDKLLTESLLLRWSGGPGEIGDSWLLAPSYTNPVDNLDAIKNPSKSLFFYNDDDANDVEIVYNPEGGVPAAWPSPNLGWYVEQPNFKTAYLQARDTSGGAWTTLLTLDATNGFDGLSYTTTSSAGAYGPGLKPTSGSTTGDRVIQHSELIGGYVICDNGVDTTAFRIRYNTEGSWGGSAITTKKPIIYVDDWDTSFGTGTLSIIWPKHLLILPDFTTDYIQFRVKMPAQTTCEGKIGLSKSVIGPVYLFARNASHGRVVSQEQNVSLKQTSSGRRFVKKMGPTRKKMSLSWAEYAGDDLQMLSDTNPDYVSLTDGGEPAGFRESLPHLFEALHEQLQGGVRTAVLCLSLPSGVTPIQSNDPKSMLRGRILQNYQRNANLGIENLEEYWTISTLEIEEEI